MLLSLDPSTKCSELINIIKKESKLSEKRKNNIIGLSNLNSIEVLDYYLTLENKTIEAIKDDENFRVVYNFELNKTKKKNLELNDFEFLKCLGKGGTASVYLGIYLL